MESTVTEIAPDLYRISTVHPRPRHAVQPVPAARTTRPFLMHTGLERNIPPTLRTAVASVIEPSRLRWIGFTATSRPTVRRAERLARRGARGRGGLQPGRRAGLRERASAARPARPARRRRVPRSGRHRLRRFPRHPHVPHAWDAGLFFDEVDATLFCSDLFFHPGDPPALALDDVVTPARDAIRRSLSGPFAKDLAYTSYTDADPPPARRAPAAHPRRHARLVLRRRRRESAARAGGGARRGARAARVIRPRVRGR